jgi:hypothetical protein
MISIQKWRKETIFCYENYSELILFIGLAINANYHFEDGKALPNHLEKC